MCSAFRGFMFFFPFFVHPLVFISLVMDFSLSLMRFQRDSDFVRTFTDFGSETLRILPLFCSYLSVRLWYFWKLGGCQNHSYFWMYLFPNSRLIALKESVLWPPSPLFFLRKYHLHFLPSSYFIKCRASLCYLDASSRLFVRRSDVLYHIRNASSFGIIVPSARP